MEYINKPCTLIFPPELRPKGGPAQLRGTATKLQGDGAQQRVTVAFAGEQARFNGIYAIDRVRFAGESAAEPEASESKGNKATTKKKK